MEFLVILELTVVFIVSLSACLFLINFQLVGGEVFMRGMRLFKVC